MFGNLFVIAELLKHVIDLGLDVQKTDDDGNSALHSLMGRYTEDEFDKILAIARQLVQAGVDVNAKNNDGKTVLHLCTEKGNTNVGPFIRELVNTLGADSSTFY